MRCAAYSASVVYQSTSVSRRRCGAFSERGAPVDACLVGARRVRASPVDASAGRSSCTNQCDNTTVTAHDERNAVVRVLLVHGGAHINDEECHRSCISDYALVSMEAMLSSSSR